MNLEKGGGRGSREREGKYGEQGAGSGREKGVERREGAGEQESRRAGEQERRGVARSRKPGEEERGERKKEEEEGEEKKEKEGGTRRRRGVPWAQVTHMAKRRPLLSTERGIRAREEGEEEKGGESKMEGKGKGREKGAGSRAVARSKGAGGNRDLSFSYPRHGESKFPEIFFFESLLVISVRGFMNGQNCVRPVVTHVQDSLGRVSRREAGTAERGGGRGERRKEGRGGVPSRCNACSRFSGESESKGGGYSREGRRERRKEKGERRKEEGERRKEGRGGVRAVVMHVQYSLGRLSRREAGTVERDEGEEKGGKKGGKRKKGKTERREK
jgi:hypothetical protein